MRLLAKQMEILFTANNAETIRYALDNNTAINIGYNYSFEIITISPSTLLQLYPKPTISAIYTLHQKGLSRISKEFLKRLGMAISE